MGLKRNGTYVYPALKRRAIYNFRILAPITYLALMLGAFQRQRRVLFIVDARANAPEERHVASLGLMFESQNRGFINMARLRRFLKFLCRRRQCLHHKEMQKVYEIVYGM
jgi:hypothetical protein